MTDLATLRRERDKKQEFFEKCFSPVASACLINKAFRDDLSALLLAERRHAVEECAEKLESEAEKGYPHVTFPSAWRETARFLRTHFGGET